MVPPKRDPQAIADEVAELGGLDLAALRERWRQLFGKPPPKSLRRAFLAKACAYQVQVEALGGLSASAQRRLRKIADAARTGGSIPAASSSRRIAAGTRLVRAWQGKTHTVTALADGGFEWDGARYRSLSAIAHAITGTSWNGLTFFGLKKRAARGAVGQRAGAAELGASTGVSAAQAGRGGRSVRGGQIVPDESATPDPGGRSAAIKKRSGRISTATERPPPSSAGPEPSATPDPALERSRHG